MAAGLGLKTFVTGDVLTAADTNGYLMQGVWVFASAAARSAAVTSPQEGNFSFLKDTNSTEYYDGSAWVAVATAGGTWTNYTPTITAESGTPTTVSASGRYIQVGKLVTVTMTVTLTSVGTASGSVLASLPFTAASSRQFAGSVKENAVSGDGGTVWIQPSGTVLNSRRIGVATYWWVNGNVLYITINYESV